MTPSQFKETLKFCLFPTAHSVIVLHQKVQDYDRFQLLTHNRRERPARLQCRGSVHHKEQRSFQGSGGDSPRHVSDKVSYMPWGADNELHTTADPKFERKIPALIANFCTYYAPHAKSQCHLLL